jgi:hypothetical protein
MNSSIENKSQPVAQSELSILLIIGNMLLAIIYMTCTGVDENHKWLNWSLIFPLLTLFVAGFVFTYRGKEYLPARIIFAVCIILSIISYLFYAVLHGMAAGFSHG